MDDTIIGFKYKLLESIGKGSFGVVYKGLNIFTKENIAIKIEKNTAKKKMLKHETIICKYLNNIEGIPKVRWFGKESSFLYTVYDLLGKDLVYLKTINGVFSDSKMYNIASQILTCLETIHSKDILHRDLKPDNIMFDVNNMGKVYIVDFGLAKKFKINGKHIQHKTNKSIVGSLNFCSINNMMGEESSRRDDLISLGYILLYLVMDALPWEHDISCDSIKESKKIENITVTNNNLKKYLNYCYSLKFNEKPNYNFLKTIFQCLPDNRSQKYNSELT